jgi:hypothetical protein
VSPRLLIPSFRVRSGIAVVATSLSLLLVMQRSPAFAGSTRAKVVVFLADDLGYHDLGVQGASIPTSVRNSGPTGRKLRLRTNSMLCGGGRVDPLTGFFSSAHGRDRLVDTGVTPLDETLTGADWGVSANGTSLGSDRPESALDAMHRGVAISECSGSELLFRRLRCSRRRVEEHRLDSPR